LGQMEEVVVQHSLYGTSWSANPTRLDFQGGVS
jgi:hypothetical protein